MTRSRPRAAIRVAFALLLAAEPAAGGNAFFDDLRAARDLAAHGDLAGARAEFARLDSVAGGLPSTTYGLAQIAARRGDRPEALRRLRAYAAMGLSRAPAKNRSAVLAIGRRPGGGSALSAVDGLTGPPICRTAEVQERFRNCSALISRGA